jgi:hypothetical protein
MLVCFPNLSQVLIVLYGYKGNDADELRNKILKLAWTWGIQTVLMLHVDKQIKVYDGSSYFPDANRPGEYCPERERTAYTEFTAVGPPEEVNGLLNELEKIPKMGKIICRQSLQPTSCWKNFLNWWKRFLGWA